jgi:hypothetical protein
MAELGIVPCAKPTPWRRVDQAPLRAWFGTTLRSESGFNQLA